jgi:hypothetical protein
VRYYDHNRYNKLTFPYTVLSIGRSSRRRDPVRFNRFSLFCALVCCARVCCGCCVWAKPTCCVAISCDTTRLGVTARVVVVGKKTGCVGRLRASRRFFARRCLLGERARVCRKGVSAALVGRADVLCRTRCVARLVLRYERRIAISCATTRFCVTGRDARHAPYLGVRHDARHQAVRGRHQVGKCAIVVRIGTISTLSRILF